MYRQWLIGYRRGLFVGSAALCGVGWGMIETGHESGPGMVWLGLFIGAGWALLQLLDPLDAE